MMTTNYQEQPVDMALTSPGTSNVMNLKKYESNGVMPH